MTQTGIVPPPPPTGKAKSDAPSKTLGVASLILGAISIPMSVFLVGGVLAIAGLITGIIHLIKGSVGRGMALAGTCLSLCGLVAACFVGYFAFLGFQMAMESMDSMTDSSYGEWTGVQAPALTVTTLDGKKISLADLKGRRVIVDIWATWCPPCREEIPHFIDLTKTHKSDELFILGISNEDEATLRAFVKKKGINYPIASVSDSDLPEPFGNTNAIPTTFFIDRKGVIQSVTVGYRDADELRKNALGPDFSGKVLGAPPEAETELTDAEQPLSFRSPVNIDVPGAVSMCTGQWDGKGPEEVVVACADNTAHVYSIDGSEIATMKGLKYSGHIELGWAADQGPRLLAYETGGQKVQVLDKQGKELWTYRLLFGLDGAHWGDLDGDGTDELIVGGNGFSGLCAVSSEGKTLWTAHLGNVWNQDVVGPGDAARVFATEAAGSVRVFDGHGNAEATLRPRGAYYTSFRALYSPKHKMAYVLAVGKNTGTCFDEKGRVLWVVPAVESSDSWAKPSVAVGDVDGDGEPEWAFRQPSQKVAIVSVDGVRKAMLNTDGPISAFGIIGGGKTSGALVTLQDKTLAIYRIDTSAPSKLDEVNVTKASN